MMMPQSSQIRSKSASYQWPITPSQPPKVAYLDRHYIDVDEEEEEEEDDDIEDDDETVIEDNEDDDDDDDDDDEEGTYNNPIKL